MELDSHGYSVVGLTRERIQFDTGSARPRASSSARSPAQQATGSSSRTLPATGGSAALPVLGGAAVLAALSRLRTRGLREDRPDG